MKEKKEKKEKGYRRIRSQKHVSLNMFSLGTNGRKIICCVGEVGKGELRSCAIGVAKK